MYPSLFRGKHPSLLREIHPSLLRRDTPITPKEGANPKFPNFTQMLKFAYHILLLILKAVLNLKNSADETVALIGEYENKFQGVFEKAAIQKAARFQGIQQVFINDAFAQLTDRNTNSFERNANKLYFILTGVYDDIIDQKLLTTHELDELFNNPYNNQQQLFEARVLVDVHLQLLNRANNSNEYLTVVKNIHQAQKDSIKQINHPISQEEVLDITCRKGGYSLLMCRYYINLPNSKELDQCWYQLGAVIQFTNDLFDIYKDLKENISTYPNRSNNIKEIKNCFDQLVNELKTTIQSIPFEQNKKDALLIKLSCIPAFGYLAIENLMKLSDKDGHLPDLNTVKRKELIIDMEKVVNRVKLISLAYKISKSN
jgi:hypothetical protein